VYGKLWKKVQGKLKVAEKKMGYFVMWTPEGTLYYLHIILI